MFSGLRLYALLGTGLVFALVLGWAMRVDHLRAEWKHRWETLNHEANTVLIALRDASDNQKLKWSGARDQIDQLGSANRTLKQQFEQQNAEINRMKDETARLKARNSALRELYRKAQAQRAAAVHKLDDMALTPGTRSDYQTLLKEADEALDLAREAGL